MFNFKEIVVKDDPGSFAAWVKKNRDSYQSHGDAGYAEACLLATAEWMNAASAHYLEHGDALEALLVTRDATLGGCSYLQASLARNGVYSHWKYKDLIPEEKWSNDVLNQKPKTTAGSKEQ